MPDVANLRVGIDGRQAKVESTALTRKFRTLAVAGGKVTASATTTSAAMGKQAVATRALGASTAKTALSTNTLASSIKSLTIGLAGFAGFAVGAGVLGIATKNAAGFSIAIAEVNTLINESFGNINNLAKAASNLSRTFGTSTQQQAKALYQIISAGAKDAAQAVELLNVTNQFSLGGVADLTIAADGLTTVLNAYGLSADSALDVSDTLFVAIREGKTTADELGSSLGQIVPIAAVLGLSIQEVTSTIAGLTKSGINTRRSVTGLRAIMVSILKPTEQQKDLAAELGLEWNAAALQAKGFVGIIRTMVEATGGNIEQMTELLATTEALTPAFSLAGQGGDDANATFLAMQTRAGATALAVDKISESLGQRLKVAGSGISATFEELGVTMLEILVPAIEGVNDGLGITLGLIKGLGVATAVAFSPAIFGGLKRASGLLRTLIGLLKVNPITTFIGALGGLVIALEGVSDELDGVNENIDLFTKVLEGNATQLETWRAVAKSVFSEVGRGAQFALFDIQNANNGDQARLDEQRRLEVQDLIFRNRVKGSDSAQAIAKFFEPERELLEDFLTKFRVRSLFNFSDLGRNLVEDFEGEEVRRVRADSISDENAAARELSRPQRLRDFRIAEGSLRSRGRDLVSQRGPDRFLTDRVSNDVSEDALQQLGLDLFERQNSELRRRRSQLPGLDRADVVEARGINAEVGGADYQRTLILREQLLKVENNLRLTEDDRTKAIAFYRKELDSLQNPHKEYTNNLREQLRLAKIIDPATRAVESSLSAYVQRQRNEGIPVTKEAIETWRELITETNELGNQFKETGPLASYAKGLDNLSDQFQNLAVSGIQGASDALADFVLSGTLDLENFGNVLRNIAKQITSLLIQRSIVGPIASLLPFADGGVFNNGGLTAFANGGVINSPTVFPFARGVGLMGEDGPEAIIPLKRGRSGRLGVENFGGGGGGDTYVSNVSVNVEGNVDSDNRVQEIATNVSNLLDGKIQKAMTDARKNGGINSRR